MKKIYLLFIVFFACISLNAQLTVTVNGLTPSCLQPCNGTINFIASGGTGPYTYTLAPSSQSNTTGAFTSVCSGSYTLTVVDAVGNSTTLTNSLPTINAPTIASVGITPVNPPTNYRAQVNYTGGQPRYYVTWVRLPFSTTIRVDTVSTMNDTLSQLTPGDYQVFVSDSTNIVNNCVGNNPPFNFSICDPQAGTGNIMISPNDTVCSGTAVTVTYLPMPFAQMNVFGMIYSSDNPNCDPSQSNGTYTCNLTQTTTFSGFWIYSTTCPPIQFPPVTITVVSCTGINESSITSESISIFPNPGNDVFTFTSVDNSDMTITIIDEAGRNCFSSIVKSGEQISPQLSAGIYFCQIKTENGLVTKKLVVTGN